MNEFFNFLNKIKQFEEYKELNILIPHIVRVLSNLQSMQEAEELGPINAESFLNTIDMDQLELLEPDFLMYGKKYQNLDNFEKYFLSLIRLNKRRDYISSGVVHMRGILSNEFIWYTMINYLVDNVEEMKYYNISKNIFAHFDDFTDEVVDEFFYKDSKVISLFEGFIYNREERIEYLKRLDKFTNKLNKSKEEKKIKKYKRKI